MNIFYFITYTFATFPLFKGLFNRNWQLFDADVYSMSSLYFFYPEYRRVHEITPFPKKGRG